MCIGILCHLFAVVPSDTEIIYNYQQIITAFYNGLDLALMSHYHDLKFFRSDNEPKKVMLLFTSNREHCNNFSFRCHVTWFIFLWLVKQNIFLSGILFRRFIMIYAATALPVKEMFCFLYNIHTFDPLMQSIVLSILQ